jgi:hypothetical protein
LAEAFGETLTPVRLKIYVRELSDIEPDSLASAFNRACRECKFFPRIAELRELAGMGVKQSQDAEARAAWDLAVDFANRYVQSDIHGGYEVHQGCRSTPPPQLSQRLEDSVRRSGGWRAFKTMTADDFPFLQKRFIEEYAAWTAVSSVSLTRLLASPQMKALAEKTKIR